MNYDHAVYCELATFCTVLHNVNGLGFLKVSLQIFFLSYSWPFCQKKKKKRPSCGEQNVHIAFTALQAQRSRHLV